jgi:hypothetical protein
LGGIAMTLSDLASIGSFVSGIAVLISLIYVSFQIRQNTLTHRATAYEKRQEYAKEQIHNLMDPALASLNLRMGVGDDTLTEVECFQYFMMQNSVLVGFDHLVWLHNNKILDEETYQAQLRLLRGQLGSPAVRAAWELWKPIATAAFRKVVEQELATLQPRSSQRFQERWKDAIRAARQDRLAA